MFLNALILKFATPTATAGLNPIAIKALKPLKITSGTMEAIKWVALLSMTIDHANRFFYDQTVSAAYCAGRLAMPLFAFILAYNLAQPGTLSRGIYTRVLTRLILFGLLATPGYMAMRHLELPLPLNIMFMLAAAVAALYFYEQGERFGKIIATAIVLIAGFYVEYIWVGILFCLAAWCYCRKPSLLALFAWLITFLLLDELNGNHWALLSLPLIYLGTKVDLKIPRIRYLFYVYYPLHLSIFYLLS
jgi:hypothetical protein